MILRSEDSMQQIIDCYNDRRNALHHDHALIDIFEGNLLCYVEEDLARQLSPKAYEQCRHRIPPINVLTKIIDKMSTIYQPPPVRRVVKDTGTQEDGALLEWYTERLKLQEMAQALELYNLCKAQLIQPYVHRGKPYLRAIPNDRFFVLGCDPVDKKRVTHLVTFDAQGDNGVRFTAYTETEFLIFNEKKEVDTAAMTAVANPTGINPYGVIPFVYRANARFKVAPTQDTDIIRMVKLVPLLLADLNYAVMYQAFSIIYGINVDEQTMDMNPSSFWRFKKDANVEGDPEIGMLKPQVDIAEVMSLVQTELALWLNTRGIRPGSVGKLEADQFASGISKLIDEMDTVEIRQKLVEVFTEIESDLWDMVMHKLHPVWVQHGLFEQKALFSAGAKVETVFSKQLPMTSRGQIVTDQKNEVDAGFTTRRRAIKTLNPSMSDDEIDDLMEEIEAEGGESGAPAPAQAMAGGRVQDETGADSGAA